MTIGKEEIVLDKAIILLNEALDGKPVNPTALNTAIQMTQYFWSSVYFNKLSAQKEKDCLYSPWDAKAKTDSEN